MSKVFNQKGKAAPKEKIDVRKVKIPSHRYSALKTSWMEIYTPLVEHCRLEVRMNLKTRSVEMRPSKETPDAGLLTKAADFIEAFVKGFEVQDAIALIRLDDIYLDSFEVKDVKTLDGDSLARCIGRMSGTHGKTKFTIENLTRTRIVVADTHIHIMGSFQNTKIARDAMVDLIRGSPATKVYAKLRGVMNRVNESV
ncbi:RNA-binding protein pno1 [Diplonema papillatum]|nr:RNA-binding protein pno1 [Diplonema papillatum]|eukprot:gene16620-25488_t